MRYGKLSSLLLCSAMPRTEQNQASVEAGKAVQAVMSRLNVKCTYQTIYYVYIYIIYIYIM